MERTEDKRVDVAFVRYTVCVAVSAAAERRQFALVRNSVSVAVRFTFIGDAVSVAVRPATERRYFALVGDSVPIAVFAGAKCDVTFVRQPIAVTVGGAGSECIELRCLIGLRLGYRMGEQRAAYPARRKILLGALNN